MPIKTQSVEQFKRSAKIEIGNPGIKRALKKYNVPRSITEFVWNRFDVDTNEIEVESHEKEDALTELYTSMPTFLHSRCRVRVYLVLLGAIAFTSSVSLEGAQALPPDVQPYPQPVPPAPKLLPKPAGAPWFAPAPPAYPYLAGRGTDGLTADTKGISNALETYVKAWLDGRVPAEIPVAFLPRGYDPKSLIHFTLVRPDDLQPSDQWLIRPSAPIGSDGSARQSYPDPHATYGVMPMYAPFGTKVIVEGDFPHARFFDLQVSPAFDPLNYRYDPFGAPEVPLLDADIVPDKSSTNPFLKGANRNASRRHYHATFVMAAGDPVRLNGSAFQQPGFRARGNTRYGSGIQYQGPWGTGAPGGHGRGLWNIGEIWMRYYLPDIAAGSLGGVALPKVTYQLPDGRTYFIKIDQSPVLATVNRLFIPSPTRPQDPKPTLDGYRFGWTKQAGISASVYAGIAMASGFTSPAGKQYVRDLDRGISGRDPSFRTPEGYEASNTSATPINYFSAGMSLGKGKVVVLTGCLPTTPSTQNGEPVMEAAQARYWSLTGYAVPTPLESLKIVLGDKNIPVGIPVHSIMDEDIVVDAQHRYVIVMSRPQDRPVNATAANGVTWVNWGNRGVLSWQIRWMSIERDWTFPLAPTNLTLPATKTVWESTTYDPILIGANDQKGPLGDYIPEVHYLDRRAFEKLGSTITPTNVPIWK